MQKITTQFLWYYVQKMVICPSLQLYFYRVETDILLFINPFQYFSNNYLMLELKSRNCLKWASILDTEPRSQKSLALPCSSPEIAGLIEQWNGLQKTQLQCQLGGNTLQSLGKVLQEPVYALNQHPIYGAVSPIAKIQGSGNQRGEMGVHHSLLF